MADAAEWLNRVVVEEVKRCGRAMKPPPRWGFDCGKLYGYRSTIQLKCRLPSRAFGSWGFICMTLFAMIMSPPVPCIREPGFDCGKLYDNR